MVKFLVWDLEDRIAIGEDADFTIFPYTGSKESKMVAEHLMFDHGDIQAKALYVRGKQLSQ